MHYNELKNHLDNPSLHVVSEPRKDDLFLIGFEMGSPLCPWVAIDFTRKDKHGRIPFVTRKKPDPAPGPGNPCWCTIEAFISELGFDKIGYTSFLKTSGQELRQFCAKPNCQLCDGYGTIQEPGNGIPPDSWNLTNWMINREQRQIRHDEYVRRNKIRACSLLCHWTNPDSGWCFNDSLISMNTGERIRAFLYRKYGADLRPT